MVVTTFSVSVI